MWSCLNFLFLEYWSWIKRYSDIRKYINILNEVVVADEDGEFFLKMGAWRNNVFSEVGSRERGLEMRKLVDR